MKYTLWGLYGCLIGLILCFLLFAAAFGALYVVVAVLFDKPTFWWLIHLPVVEVLGSVYIAYKTICVCIITAAKGIELAGYSR